MRPSTTQLLFTLVGVLLFNYLFWEENLGLNALLFTAFYLAALWWLFPESRASRGFQVTAAGMLLMAGMVVWHNSGAAKFAWWLSGMCAAGFVQEASLRYVFYAFGQYLTGWLQAPGHLMRSLNDGNSTGARQEKKLRRQVGLAIVPLLVVTVFYFLYYLANDKFAALADAFWRQVGQLFQFDVSIVHILFVVFGFFLIGAAFWRNRTSLAQLTQSKSDDLLRRRPPRGRYKISMLQPQGLRKEYRQVLLLLWMLNGLLLIVNATDVRYVWFGFDEAAKEDLKGYVHEGTYFLIASILLAMGVLFQVFRKNLNFYPNNRPLQRAAAIWLLQNAVLALSVGIRNARYIDYHGLAYRRIGVILFLLLVFFGLLTLWQKIHRRRTRHWLWRQNGWAFYVLLLLNGCVAWDMFITRYNLSGRPKGAIDVDFMIHTLSDHNLFLLEENLAVLPQKEMWPRLDAEKIQQGVANKRRNFDWKMQQVTWKSWNGADARNAR